MYRAFLLQIQEWVGYDWAGTALGVALVAVLILVGRKDVDAETSSGWRFLASSARMFTRNALTVGLALTIGLFLCALLLVQARLFTERHGRVTQRNYDAVTTKWGRPQEQRELRVDNYKWVIITEETFAGGAKRRVSEKADPPDNPDETQLILSDETFDITLDDKGRPRNPMQRARRIRTRVRETVPQNSIRTGTIDLTLTNTPRFLGGAGYAGYALEASYEFEIENRNDQETRARLRFPLPGEGYGLFDRLRVRIDGEAPANSPVLRDGALEWWRPMSSGEKAVVTVQYHTRGLEYFRYWPGNLREQYHVTMNVRGIPPKRLNFPIGSMSPMDDLAALKGEDYTLHWDLSNAVTNFSIGLIVPRPIQPGFEVARILKDAPPGLMILGLLLFVTRWLLGRDTHLLALGLAVTAHYLGYAAFAHISDHVDSFPTAIAASMALPAVCGSAFWLLRDGWSSAGIQSAVLQFLFGIGYPLAVYWENSSGAVLHVSYTVLTGYVMVLAALAWRRNRQCRENSHSISVS